MRKSSIVGLILTTQLLTIGTAKAAIALYDWGFNIDGTTYCALGTCDFNGLGNLPAAVDSSSFDFSTGLGSISVTMTGVGSHSFDIFLDHEIDEPINTFFNENGTVSGAPAAGQSWEIDEPGYVFGDIFDNFLASTLDNTNSIPPGFEDDVSMAMGWDFVLAPGEQATIDIVLSQLTPVNQVFLLTHFDPDSYEGLTLSSTLSISQVPIPAGLWLFVSGLLGLVGMARHKKAT